MTDRKPYGDLPLLDDQALHDLEQQLEDSTAARSFARDFISIWDERYAKLSTAVLGGYQTASLDAVLSVKIASAMVGAARLAKHAQDLEEAIRRGAMADAVDALPNLELCGRCTVNQLRQHI